MRNTWNGGHRRFRQPAPAIATRPLTAQQQELERRCAASRAEVDRKVADRNKRMAEARAARGPVKAEALDETIRQIGQIGERRS